MAWMLSLKLGALSAAVVFTALGVKASVPLATTHLSPLWNMCLLCFKPPFLFLVLNAIIIYIVVSSRRCFHHSFDTTTTPPPAPVLHVNPVLLNASVSATLQDQLEPEQEEEEEEKAIDVGVVVDSVEESALIPLQSMESTEIPPEYLSPADRPVVSGRFGNRKPPKSTHEGGGRAFRVVAKPKRHETLENTWKQITEGRAMPLSRHVRKCDTWQNRGATAPQEVRKWEAFKERRTNQIDEALSPVSVSVSGGRLRKEPSLSQDELNRRVEAFIRKFNEQMRLQRQESLNQSKQMISRGAD